MDKTPLNIILLGRSGSGKGTQAKKLAEHFHLEYIGTGDLLRRFSERDNVAAWRMKTTLAQGKLAPSWLPFFVWMEKLAYTDAHIGVLFDGSPRKIEEARILDDVLVWFGRDNTKVVLLDISREEAYRRLMSRRICSRCHKGAYVENETDQMAHCRYCGGDLTIRAEDNPEGIKVRLDWFDNEVAKVIEHYKDQGKLVAVNGEQTPEETHKEIITKLAGI